MFNLSRSAEDRTKLKLSEVVIIQSANGEGEAVLEELIKFSKDIPYVIPTKLTYLKQQKCWVNYKNKILLFNIAEEPNVAVDLIEKYKTGLQATKAKTDVSASPLAGFLATDNGTIISLDIQPDEVEGTTKALKIDRN